MPEGSSLVEIGGGEPTVAQALVDLGYRVTVLDPYNGSGNGPVEYEANCRNYTGVSLVRSLFNEQCRFAPGGFDAVYSVSVIEHIPLPELAGLFAAMRKFVRPGGSSIHCIDVVLRGWAAGKHATAAQEIMLLQHELTGQPGPNDDHAYDRLAKAMEADLETFLLSAHGHNVWRNRVPYERYAFRRVASLQLCGRVQFLLAGHPASNAYGPHLTKS